MNAKILKAAAAALMSAAMMTTAVTAPLNVSAEYQLLGETSFEHKMLPWQTCESAPAKQIFNIADGTAHIRIINPTGAGMEKWDLQFRHRGLSFKKDHEYQVSFTVKSYREGMELDTHIGDYSGNLEYFVIDGDEMHNGAAMDGNWGSPLKLSNLSKKITGTFIPTEDIDNAEWTFQYAKGTKYAGNAEAGDEIWFEEMSIIDKTEETAPPPPDRDPYGYVSRDNSGIENNYISVNQLGYYPKLEKIATLGDNSGDIVYGSSQIDIGIKPLRFDLIETETGESVYNGKTEPHSYTDKDSGDKVHTIDFTEFDTPGRYYLKVEDWRSPDFDISNDIYDKSMLSNALNFFYQSRSGDDVIDKYITSGDKKVLEHAGINKGETGVVQNTWIGSYADAKEALETYASSTIDCSGGWFDSDDYANHSKSVVKGGNTLWTLMNMYERASQTKEGKKKFADKSGTVVSPESGNGIPDILDECLYELDFIKKMVVQKDEPEWGKYAGMVYHRVNDYKWTGLATRPWDYITEYEITRVVQPPTFAATLNFAACAAQASRLIKPFDAEKAEEYLELAKTSFEAFKQQYMAYSDKESHNPKSLYAPLMSEYDGDINIKDEAYHAACELLATTGDTEYYDYINSLAAKDFKPFEINAMLESYHYKYDYYTISNVTSFEQTNMSAPGSLSLLLNKDTLKDILTDDDIYKIQKTAIYAADRFIEVEKDQGYGIPYYADSGYANPSSLMPDILLKGYEQGSNTKVINNAIMMAYAYDITKDQKYINGTATAMDYLLGRNPMSFSYITGCGDYAVENPYHAYWANSLDDTFPKAPDGVLTSGPNAHIDDNILRAMGFVPGNESNPSQRCYADNIESWSTNSPGINQNAPLAWVVSFLQDEGSGYVQQTVTYPTEAPTEPTEPQPTTEYNHAYYVSLHLPGDLDINGVRDMADITILAKCLLFDDFPMYQKIMDHDEYSIAKENRDVNQDGSLDVLDLSLLIEFNLGNAEIPPSKALQFI